MAKTKRAKKGSKPKTVLSLNLAELPDLVVYCILKYLPYEKVAKMRILCRRFNHICGRTLNMGWYLSQRMYYHSDEERGKRGVTLAISLRLLSECYGDFMQLGMCCFVPGKVLDVLLPVLRSTDRANDDGEDKVSVLQGKAVRHFRARVSPAMWQGIRDQRATISGLQGRLLEIEGEMGALKTVVAELRKKDGCLAKEEQECSASSSSAASGMRLRKRRRGT